METRTDEDRIKDVAETIRKLVQLLNGEIFVAADLGLTVQVEHFTHHNRATGGSGPNITVTTKRPA